MATNPPITIGPFNNVPAPGSGVKSDWSQSISTYVAPTPWAALAYTNSWVNYGAPYQAGQYRKRGDIVEVRGVMKTGTMSQPAFTLPAGFRPPADMLFAQNSGGAYALLTVTAAGTVTPAAASNASVSLNFSFSVTP